MYCTHRPRIFPDLRAQFCVDHVDNKLCGSFIECILSFPLEAVYANPSTSEFLAVWMFYAISSLRKKRFLFPILFGYLKLSHDLNIYETHRHVSDRILAKARQ
jgi:hypothetical protein